MMANLNISEKNVRRQIASAINLVVHLTRFSDGTRRVTQITEVTGMEGEVILMQDLFLFENQGVSADGRIIGNFTATGVRPRFAEKLGAVGFEFSAGMFEPTRRGRR